MTGFFTSPRIAFGPGAVEQLSGLGARRAFLVVDPAVASQRGHRRVVEELAKSETTVQVFEAGPEVDRLDSVGELAKRLTDFAPDWLVAIGGGRTIDGAKAARLGFERPDLSLSALTPVFELAEPPRCRLVAIPTTSGSGSEASWSVDLRSMEGEPLELAHRSLVPDWAIVDAGFAETLSNDLRRDGAVEALGQAVEAYLSAWANPFSDALALSVARTVLERLPHALRWSDDPDAKEALHGAATLAGLAASNAQRGVAHALARALVGPTGLPYAHLLGIVLPVRPRLRPPLRPGPPRDAGRVGAPARRELAASDRRPGAEVLRERPSPDRPEGGGNPTGAARSASGEHRGERSTIARGSRESSGSFGPGARGPAHERDGRRHRPVTDGPAGGGPLGRLTRSGSWRGPFRGGPGSGPRPGPATRPPGSIAISARSLA